METKTLKIDKYEFRIANLNGLDVLAIQSQIQFDTKDSAKAFFTTILECMEFKLGDEWLPVKTKDREIYYPNGIENDVLLIKQLVDFFLNDYLKPIFTKSDVSK